MIIKKSQWLFATAMIVVIILIVTAVAWIAIVQARNERIANDNKSTEESKGFQWQPPDTAEIPSLAEGKLIQYGRDLIAHTSNYFGPKGKVAIISNGMNCQNCHLEAGTRAWGNNYSAVFSTYPKFRERSGSIENIYKRVNDCIERSLDGKALDTNSREMQAIYAYIKWLGKNVPAGVSPAASGIKAIPFPDRAADPEKGQKIYTEHCQRCHEPDGVGLLYPDGIGYQYPPLWGEKSYNNGAGLFRLSRLAGYVKENMPFDAPEKARHLTSEEAWDVAAYINSQPRPEKDFKMDWPNIAGKPFDYPYGPYADSFSEQQHKYGPFAPVKEATGRVANKKIN